MPMLTFQLLLIQEQIDKHLCLSPFVSVSVYYEFHCLTFLNHNIRFWSSPPLSSILSSIICGRKLIFEVSHGVTKMSSFSPYHFLNRTMYLFTCLRTSSLLTLSSHGKFAMLQYITISKTSDLLNELYGPSNLHCKETQNRHSTPQTSVFVGGQRRCK